MKRKLQWLVVVIAVAALVQTVIVTANSDGKSNQILTAQPPGEPSV